LASFYYLLTSVLLYWSCILPTIQYFLGMVLTILFFGFQWIKHLTAGGVGV